MRDPELKIPAVVIALVLVLAASCGEDPSVELPPVEVPVFVVPPAEDTTPEDPGDSLSVPETPEAPVEVPESPLECPEPVVIVSACSFCTDQALGWMCQLPAGEPYDD